MIIIQRFTNEQWIVNNSIGENPFNPLNPWTDWPAQTLGANLPDKPKYNNPIEINPDGLSDYSISVAKLQNLLQWRVYYNIRKEKIQVGAKE